MGGICCTSASWFPGATYSVVNSEASGPVHNPTDGLPDWMLSAPFGVPQEVQDIMHEKGEKLTLFDVSGPPVRLLWIATLSGLTFALSVPWLAFAYTQCEGEGTAVYSSWLWIAFLPYALVMMAIEWRCFMYTAVPVLQWLKVLPVPCSKNPSLRFSLAWHLPMAFMMQMDIMTQGLFLATTLRSFRCEGFEHVLDAWERVWHQSVLSWITWGASLKVIVVACWAIQILQMVLYAGYALPTHCHCLDFQCRSEKKGYPVLCGLTTIWHADALKALAGSSRMPMLQAGQLKLSLERAKKELHGAVPNYVRYLQVLKMELRHLLLRLLLVCCFVNCTKLEVQTTFFALSRMEDAHEQSALHLRHTEQLLSIAVAHCTSFVALNDICWGARALWDAVKEPAGKLNDDDSAKESWEIRCLLGVAISVAVLCGLIQAHGLAKLVAAFVCQDSVWNFPNKCVQVH
ncbi:unnamed protein product [Symbiodinium natans]|uniref:Uncharacterized protein n=1 Tax=Symbiodinium natans TaxID=878477 RepID=A0A812L2G2_9DINO|nr:unnamed protein product [Symbiodinium natans]